MTDCESPASLPLHGLLHFNLGCFENHSMQYMQINLHDLV